MEFEPGGTPGHDRPIETIGGGGMGVVWRASDSTLDREVKAAGSRPHSRVHRR